MAIYTCDNNAAIIEVFIVKEKETIVATEAIETTAAIAATEAIETEATEAR